MLLKHFKGDASYKCLATSALAYSPSTFTGMKHFCVEEQYNLLQH
jgi:hypothetical protein